MVEKLSRDRIVLRHFQSEEDYTHLAVILTASENADHVPINISAEELKESLAKSPRFELDKDLVIAEVDGQASGYGRVQWWEEDTQRVFRLSGFVLPQWRSKGLGTKILTRLEERARGIAKEHPATISSSFQINATHYQAGIHALARQAGYGVKESWVLMVRPNLEDIPEVALPIGLEVRPVLPEHLSAIWYAMEEAYVPEGGPAPMGTIPEEVRNQATFQPELWQVAWEISSGSVVGSVMTYINQAENKQLGILRGYTEGISTVPAWQRHGVARALVARSLMVQREAGMKESALVSSGEKPGNLRLYASCGFKKVKRDTVYEKAMVIETK